MPLVRYLVWVLARVVLSLRYRVHVEGLEQVRGLKQALVLPNHPGYIDPPLALTALWGALAPRPMVYAEAFRNPLIFWLPKVLGAVQVPDLEQHSAAARAQAQEAIDAVVAGLRRGQNHILWPAGRVQRQDHEELAAARSLADILRAVPEAQIVAVRTRGLWGSSFTFARTAGQPNLVRNLLRGAGILLANLVFFTPRRPVTITIERIDRARLPGLTREQVNPFFEQWYNAPGPERPTFVPYHPFLGRRTYAFPPMSAPGEVGPRQVTPEVRAAVVQMLADKLKRELGDAERQANTKLDLLGLDSLDRMELALAVEQRFGFAGAQVPTTLGELFLLAQGLAAHTPPKPPPPAWFNPATGDQTIRLHGSTIPEAFIHQALRLRRDLAVADDLSGAVTYEKLLVGARVMARRFAQIPGPNIGLMLPASAATDLCFLALHLAGKLPVLMNWTTGPANLAHAARVTGLTHVITSRRFIDRTAIAIEGTQYLFVEDLRAGIGRLELLTALLTVRFAPGVVRRGIPRVDPEAPAVVLFTSGSEKAPKAVPLTHRNLLSCLADIPRTIDLSRRDALLGFLPAFHSFGLTVTSLFPILGGLRLVHHADPTDAAGLVRKIAAYRPTLVCGTPTFVGYILDRAKPGDLASLRLIVVGAEKAPPALFERAAALAPQAHVLEGYGITECSPLVAVNRPGHIRHDTVGTPLPSVQVRVVDPASFAPLPAGEMGLLLVHGPNVFPGYLGAEATNPFHDLDGQRWYITGDLATLDADGFIHFRGRLKRFLKAGGEMISLPALEEPFAQRYPPTDEGPRVAVEGVETPTGRKIVLFTIAPLSLRDANALLWDQGFRGVMRLDEVRPVDRIPVLGTGKTDYKVLRAWIESGA